MSDAVKHVTLGGSFRTTWVSSGAVASPIVYNIRTGSETLVSSYQGVSSGNGHYYVDARVDSSGLWKGEWYGTVSANTYRNTEYLLATPNDTDQPGRYITWDDVVHRFVGFANVVGAVYAASHYLSYAEGYVDSRLGSKFSIPFSNNNVTIRDLTIDVVYLRSIRGKSEEYDVIMAEVNSRFGALLSGEAVMVTTSGFVSETLPTAAWSSTQDYHPIFSPVLPHIDMVPSSAQVADEYADRGVFL